MVFLFKQKLLKDFWLCFALILGNISSNDFVVLCLAACRQLSVPITKATSEMQRPYP